MSTHLATYLDLIPLGDSITQMQNTLVGNLTMNGWQLLAQVDGLGGYSDVIPPATEAIGTSTFREVVRIYFPNNTTITVGSYQVCIADAFPQQFWLTALTAGAVQAGVTIGGVTVQGVVGTNTSTANQNLAALYAALEASSDPTIMGWDFYYNGTDTLVGTRGTISGTAASVTATNVTRASVGGAAVLAGMQSGETTIDLNWGYSVTTDLTNGFVYYMAVFSRSFTLGTKTIGGVTGPVFASYANHADALANTPDSPYCTPIELVIGTHNTDNTCKGRVTHNHGIPWYWGASSPIFGTASATAPNSTPEHHPYTGIGYAGSVQDTPGLYAWYSGTWRASCNEITFVQSGLGNMSYGYWVPLFKVLPLGMAGHYAWEASDHMNSGNISSNKFVYAIHLDDIFTWVGPEPTETCSWSAIRPILNHTSSGITLAQAMDATTSYTSIALSGTAGLPTQGGVLIGSEQINYTGISGSSITGCTRAVDGSVGAAHQNGSPVTPGAWYTHVNTAAIYCGPLQPV